MLLNQVHNQQPQKIKKNNALCKTFAFDIVIIKGYFNSENYAI